MHNPGSTEAIHEGCTCPVLDNEYGRGFMGMGGGEGIFVYNCDCPYHIVEEEEDND